MMKLTKTSKSQKSL